MPRRVPLPRALVQQPFTVAAGKEAGLSAHRMRAADLDRPFHGIRTRSGQSDSLHGKCVAYLERMPAGGFFSHLTAARIWRVPLPKSLETADVVPVTVRAPTKPPRGRGVVGHRLGDPAVTQLQRFELPVADPASTWCHLGSLLLRRRVDEYSGRGVRACTRAIALVRQGAESRQESLLRLAILRHGLPEPELNQEVFDQCARWIGRVDMIYREWRIVVEYDGDHHRTDPVQYERDLERWERLSADRWRVVRVRKRGMRGDPSSGVLKVEAALRAAGWRP